MQWSQVLYVEVPVFPGILMILGVKNGVVFIDYGLSKWGPLVPPGGVLLIYRGTGSEKDCLTRVNHPPDRKNGVIFDVFLIENRSKSSIFSPKKCHFWAQYTGNWQEGKSVIFDRKKGKK